MVSFCLNVLRRKVSRSLSILRATQQKKARMSNKKGTMINFLPLNFSKFWAFKTLHLPKRHMLLEVLIANKAFFFLKKGIACEYHTQ